MSAARTEAAGVAEGDGERPVWGRGRPGGASHSRADVLAVGLAGWALSGMARPPGGRVVNLPWTRSPWEGG